MQYELNPHHLAKGFSCNDTKKNHHVQRKKNVIIKKKGEKKNKIRTYEPYIWLDFTAI